MRKKLIYIFLIFLLCFSYTPIYANELKIHGFIEGTYTFRAVSNEQKNQDIIASREILRLDISSFSESGIALFQTKADFIHDGIKGGTELDLREAYMDLYGKSYDVRLGKQVITWGLGDLLFINDIFPKSWDAFYSGKNMEYLKLGVEALKLGIHPGSISFEMIAMPTFQADELPSPDRFIFANPFSNISNQMTETPAHEFKNMELALRIYHKAGIGDLSVYTYKGFYHTPSGIPKDTTSVTYFYPELNIYGASYQINGLGGVISMEEGYCDSRDDKKGTDPFIDNSRYKSLLGYSKQVSGDLHLGLQYFREDIKGNAENKTKQIATVRLTQFLKYETWKLSLFGFYGINEEDYMFIPEVSYKMTDELSLTAGGNVIEGKEEFTAFGRFKENDNVYMRVKYDF